MITLVKIDLEFWRNSGPGRILGGIRWISGFHLPAILEFSGIPGPESWSPVEFRVGGTRIPESGGIPVQPFWRPVEVQSPTVFP